MTDEQKMALYKLSINSLVTRHEDALEASFAKVNKDLKLPFKTYSEFREALSSFQGKPGSHLVRFAETVVYEKMEAEYNRHAHMLLTEARVISSEFGLAEFKMHDDGLIASIEFMNKLMLSVAFDENFMKKFME